MSGLLVNQKTNEFTPGWIRPNNWYPRARDTFHFGLSSNVTSNQPITISTISTTTGTVNILVEERGSLIVVGEVILNNASSPVHLFCGFGTTKHRLFQKTKQCW